MTVSHNADLQLMRASMLLESDPAAAARNAREILTGAPGHTEAGLLLAAACRRLGQFKEAAAALESLSPEHRDTPFMQLELGRAYAASGHTEAAIAAFRQAVALDPGLAEAWQELAAQLLAAGDNRGGDTAYGHYSRLAPDPPQLKDAMVALAENRLEAAEALLKRHLQQAPHDVVALRMLGETATRLDNFVEAQSRLVTCLALAPGYGRARFELANLLHLQQRDSEVLPLVERLLASEPDKIEFLSLKAQALRLLGRSHEAVTLMEQAVTSHPDEENAWLLCGHLLREVGQQARAIEMYRRAIQVRPEYGHAYSSLANLKTFRFAPEDVTAMRQQLASGTLRNSERIAFEFAMGKALEDEAQFAESFEHYARGNSLQYAVVGHNAEGTAADVQRAKALYTPAFFAERAGWGSQSREPIFIVGLPRSGSTLLEQMLASHSQVEGTRELVEVPTLALETMPRAESADQTPYPESLQLAQPPGVRSPRSPLPGAYPGASPVRQAALCRQDARQLLPHRLHPPAVPQRLHHRHPPPPARLRLLVLQAVVRPRFRLYLQSDRPRALLPGLRRAARSFRHCITGARTQGALRTRGSRSGR